jgi:DNA-binding MarR family transcriptional regulator
MPQIPLSAFADNLNEIMSVIMKGFGGRLVKELYKTNITLPQFFILKSLYREGQMKMTDLARYMNVTTAAMTGLVDRLVRDGYIERVRSDNDRRIIKVKLTSIGNGLVKRVNGRRRQMVIRIFGKISEGDRRDYLRILNQIKDILLKSEAR